MITLIYRHDGTESPVMF